MPTVKKWKRFETRVAKYLGGERIPVTGKGRGDRDVETPLLCIQTKYRNAIWATLLRWMDEICLTSLTHRKTGVLVLAKPGMDTGDALVVMRLRDFQDFHGSAPRPDGLLDSGEGPRDGLRGEAPVVPKG